MAMSWPAPVQFVMSPEGVRCTVAERILNFVPSK